MTRSRTHFKLAEASYFLLKADKNWRNVPDFDFYLSAFISAARSVTWVMNAEFGKVPGWKDWFEEKKPNAEIRDFLRRVNYLRVRSQKTTPIATRTTATVHIPKEELTAEVLEWLKDSKHARVRLQPVDSRNEEFFLVSGDKRIAVGRLQKAQHELPEFPGEHAIAVCERYLKLLSALVDECERCFPLQMPSTPAPENDTRIV